VVDRVAMAGYSLMLMAALVLGSPYWLARMFFSSRSGGKYRAGLRERLGRVPAGLKDAVQGLSGARRVVWVHAVSVGEVLAATRLVAELEAALGAEWVIVVSTTTATGQALARERFVAGASGATGNGNAGRVFYYPLDFAWAVRAYLRVLKPELLVLMESEIWPRMLVECGRRGIPVAVVNARVSDRSYARGVRVKAVWGRVLQRVSLFLAQSEEDAGRLVAMGARAEAVRAIGNLKYDVRAPKESRVAELIKEAAAGRPIVVAGSTVDARPMSEEEIFLQAGMGPVWQGLPNTLLVLAPRHPDRFDEVTGIANDFLPTVRATELLRRGDETSLTEKIIVLDTIGDLAAVYGIADAAFIGGSLVARGGHNPLEAARFGVPVVMGPSFENFRDIVGKMREANAICLVKDEFACHEALLNLLGRRLADREVGERGRAVFEAQSGATGRAVEALLGLLKKTGDEVSR
jgi:3-deoxy-D-manno-octulosonic-acid transferase